MRWQVRGRTLRKETLFPNSGGFISLSNCYGRTDPRVARQRNFQEIQRTADGSLIIPAQFLVLDPEGSNADSLKKCVPDILLSLGFSKRLLDQLRIELRFS